MRSLWRDILAALMMGVVVPGLMLNFAVMFLQRETPIQSIQITIPEETEYEQTALPVLVRQTDGIIQQRDMDAYLTGVLLAEMPASFETEALKAQAVAARTYARKAWETGGKHGDGSVCTQPGCCQAYMTKGDYLAQGGTEEDYEKIENAVLATSGLCLQYEEDLIEATYFSCSGGSTEDAAAVWGVDYPYLQAVESPGEEEAAWYTDTVVFTKAQFAQALGEDLEGNPLFWFGTTTYTDGGGVETMLIGETTYTGTQLRSLLGLRSTAFSVSAAEDTISITTRGYGHRVGMSQYGADAMAMEGSSYEEILAHYYLGSVLVKITA